jgi:hypothetical protein
MRLYPGCAKCGVAWIDPFAHPELAGTEKHADDCMHINQDVASMTQFRLDGGYYMRTIE